MLRLPTPPAFSTFSSAVQQAKMSQHVFLSLALLQSLIYWVCSQFMYTGQTLQITVPPSCWWYKASEYDPLDPKNRKALAIVEIEEGEINCGATYPGSDIKPCCQQDSAMKCVLGDIEGNFSTHQRPSGLTPWPDVTMINEDNESVICLWVF